MSERRRSASLVCFQDSDTCDKRFCNLPTAFCLLPTVFCCARAIGGVELRSKQMVSRNFILSLGSSEINDTKQLTGGFNLEVQPVFKVNASNQECTQCGTASGSERMRRSTMNRAFGRIQP